MSKTLTLALSLTLALAAPAAFAQTAAPPAGAAPETSAAPVAAPIEPKAVELLKAASAALGAAKTLSFTATSSFERHAPNGQPLFFSTVNEVLLQRPDKLRVITLGDGTPDEFYYDGKTMAAYVPSLDLVAVAEAPETVEKFLDHAWDKAAIYFPFADVLVDNPYEDLSKHLQSAFYIGSSIAVGGVKTDMIAIATDDVAGQIWLGAEDHLPRLIKVVYAHEPAHALYETAFANWKLGAAIEPASFASEKAAKAKHIPFSAPAGLKADEPKAGEKTPAH